MDKSELPTRRISHSSASNKLFLIVLLLSAVLGIAAGYLLANRGSSALGNSQLAQTVAPKPDTPQADKSTFRDFAEGKLVKKPAPSGKNPTYTEGTHLLIREGATPVALTSSVVDLSKYEGKNVKVYGETQKALKEGWLMDVGLVEEKM